MTYRWLPYGQIDLGFRFERSVGFIGIGDALVVVVFAAVVAVPAAWAAHAVARAEGATGFRRSPVLVAMAAALVFATMALGSRFVLFSGQQGIQELVHLGTAELLYLTVAKWLALIIAFAAGWRGGPIFPLFFSVSALAVLSNDVIGTNSDLVMIAGIVAVSMVFLKGNIPAAFVLTLYVVPISFAGVILLGAVGAALALAIAGSLGALPRVPSEPDVAAA